MCYLCIHHHYHQKWHPNIICISSSSQVCVSEEFSSQEQENKFYKYFLDCHLIFAYYIDEIYFRKFDFFKSFTKVNLKIFVCNKPGENLQKLDKIFYANLSSKIRKSKSRYVRLKFLYLLRNLQLFIIYPKMDLSKLLRLLYLWMILIFSFFSITYD